MNGIIGLLGDDVSSSSRDSESLTFSDLNKGRPNLLMMSLQRDSRASLDGDLTRSK